VRVRAPFEQDTYAAPPDVFLIAPFAHLPSITIVILLLVSLLGGIGITAIGPGGVLATIALFTFTDLSPAEIAGPAIVTHIGTGIAGSLAYLLSRQLRQPRTRRLSAVMAIVAIIGTALGALVNARVSSQQFGVLLAVFVMLVGASVLVQERQRARRPAGAGAAFRGTESQIGLGGAASVVNGMFGLGGPMISVPLMVQLGFPMLSALAAAQTQSIVVTSVGMASYVAQGAVSWPLVVLTGVPQLIWVWLGWKVAHAQSTRPLKITLALTLIVLGPVMALNR
jgi:uncharacterized membrane protein YfcA